MFTRAIELIEDQKNKIKWLIKSNELQIKDRPDLSENFRRLNSDLEFDVHELEIAITALKDRK